MAARGFRAEQRSVARRMAAALVIAVGVLGMAVATDRAAPPAPFLSRLHVALRADLFVVIWLAAAIANVARLRFFSERDIAAASADTQTRTVQMAGAMLQNTVEQVALAVSTHLIVTATFDRSDVLVTALVALFAAGRLLFWAGYRHGARGRAFGFGLTFYPSVLALLAALAATMSAGIA